MIDKYLEVSVPLMVLLFGDKNVFDGHINMVDMAEQIINELEDMLIKLLKSKIQRDKED